MKKINWQYTFGEVLIVIIGITIAFSMNTCAENSKENKLKKQYLENLKKDIEANKTVLEENIIQLGKNNELAKNILPHLDSDSKEKMKIIGDVFKISTLVEFFPEESTYQTLVNSGDLSLINNIELKTAIQKHFTHYESIKRAYDRQVNIHKKYLADYYIYNIEYSNFRKNLFPFKDEKLLLSIIRSKSGSYDIQISASKKGVINCEEILKQISNSLK